MICADFAQINLHSGILGRFLQLQKFLRWKLISANGKTFQCGSLLTVPVSVLYQSIPALPMLPPAQSWALCNSDI